MKLRIHYHQSNKRLALTKINQSVRNIFSNCHQPPTRRNTYFTQNRAYSCPTVWTLISNPPSGESDVKPQTTNTSKPYDFQLEPSCPSLKLVIPESYLSDKTSSPSSVITRDRDRSDQKKAPGLIPNLTHFINDHFPPPTDRNRNHLSPPEKTESLTPAVAPPVRDRDRKQFPGKTPPQYHIELTLSPSILGPVILDLCFSKGVCSSITTARDRDRLDQKQPPRETLTSTDDNPNCDLAKTTTYHISVSHTLNPFSSPPVAKTTIDLLSVPHTFNPLSSPLVAKTNTDPLSVSHTLSPFSSPPVSAKEHVSVTPNSAKTIKLEHHYFSLYLTQITDFTEPPNIRPRRRYDSNLAHLAPLKHGFFIFRMNRTRRCEPRLEQHYFTLYFTLFSELTKPTNFRPRHRYESNVAHLAPPKHGILILNG